MIMNKKILISIATISIALATLSTFFELSQNISGKFVAPVAINIYATLTFLVLISVSLFIIFRKN